jgi:hypothetical protein
MINEEVQSASETIETVAAEAPVEIKPVAKKRNVSVPVESFDWDAFESELDIYDADKKTIEGRYDTTLQRVAEHRIKFMQHMDLNFSFIEIQI